MTIEVNLARPHPSPPNSVFAPDINGRLGRQPGMVHALYAARYYAGTNRMGIYPNLNKLLNFY